MDTFCIFFCILFWKFEIWRVQQRRSLIAAKDLTNDIGAQRLHAARGEVCNEPHGRAHAHEHLPQTGDRQDAEGVYMYLFLKLYY